MMKNKSKLFSRGSRVIPFLFLVYLGFLGCNNPFTPPKPPKPEKVKLVHPINGDTLAPGKRTFSWMLVPNTELYHLQVSKTANFDPCIIDTKTVYTSYSDTLADTVEYYWRVKVQTLTYHEWSDWSDTWAFVIKKINFPPDTPHNEFPHDGDSGISIAPTLGWESGDPNGDTVTYIIYFGQDSAGLNPLDTLIDPSGSMPAYLSYPMKDTLDTLTTYFWKVNAYDQDTVAYGPLWNFTTGRINHPPAPPDVPTGPTQWYIDEICEFTTQTNDPEGDSVRYKLDFGDGSSVDWTSFLPSGQPVTVSHIYTKIGAFYIKAKAQDKPGGESEWSDSTGITIKVGPGACWVADNDANKVVKLGKGGTKICQFDDQGGLPWHHPGMVDPLTLAVDPQDGACWIACSHENTIFKLAPTCSFLIYLHGPSQIGGSIPSTPCIDKNGDCWMVCYETKNFVKYERYTATILKSIYDWGLTQYEYPVAIALDVDNNWIWAVELNMGGPGHISKWDIIANTMLFRLEGFNGLGAEVDPVTHYCWVADAQNNAVAKISPNGQATKFYGFNTPLYVSINPNTHEVWVADKDNNRVVKLSEAGNELCSYAGLNQPTAVEVDPNDGSCWISDAGNNRVVKVSANCQFLFEVDGSIFVTPMGLSVNPNADP